MSDGSNTSNTAGTEAVVNQSVEQIAGAESAETAQAEEGQLDATEGEEQLLEDSGSAEEGTEESAEEAIEEEIKELKKKLKIKVDGQELEEELDWNNEDDLVAKVQKAKAFDKKAQEAAQYRKDMQNLLGALQENPAAVLQQLGLDVSDFAAKHLEAQIEELSKSPEQLAQEQMQKELEELRAEKERLSKERETAERQRLLNEEAAKIENEILDAFKDYDGLLSADDPTVLQDISRAMYLQMKKGNVNVSVKDVIPQVEKRYVERLQNRIGSLSKKDMALVEKLIGKDVFEEARKKRVSKKRKAKTETAKQIVKETGANSNNTNVEEPVEKGSYKDFFKPY
jgi:hypothetical protein